MNEMAMALRQISKGLPTAIQQINYPIHKGQPNPAHGKFYFVGSVPYECTEESTNGVPQIPPNRKSKKYDTEQEALNAGFAAGCERIQGIDCKWINKAE